MPRPRKRRWSRPRTREFFSLFHLSFFADLRPPPTPPALSLSRPAPALANRYIPVPAPTPPETHAGHTLRPHSHHTRLPLFFSFTGSSTSWRRSPTTRPCTEPACGVSVRVCVRERETEGVGGHNVCAPPAASTHPLFDPHPSYRSAPRAARGQSPARLKKKKPVGGSGPRTLARRERRERESVSMSVCNNANKGRRALLLWCLDTNVFTGRVYRV